MKILKHKTREWWEGLVIDCRCNAKFELEKWDKVFRSSITGLPAESRAFLVQCPECGLVNEIKMPHQ